MSKKNNLEISLGSKEFVNFVTKIFDTVIDGAKYVHNSIKKSNELRMENSRIKQSMENGVL